VSVTSSRNAWAVGYHGTVSHPQPLIERWNGRSWKIQPSPKLTSRKYNPAVLNGVAATSSTNAWAVGSDSHGDVTEHWNGRSWKIQPSPKLARRKDITPVLNGVAATSSTNAWAVGIDSHGGVIEHWNGRSWKIQPSPKLTSPKYNAAVLAGVAATSSTNAWAVGDYYTARGDPRALIEHWNGRAWKVQPSPNPSFNFPFPGQDLGPGIQLMGVTATSSTNAWAVGYISVADQYGISGTRTVVEHWNGRSWKIRPGPNERRSPQGEGAGGEAVDNQLYAVAATSSTDAWAVGWPIKGASIWQWNGRNAWRAQASPKRGAALYAVAAKSSNIWAVGADYGTASNRYGVFAGYGGPHKRGLAVHCRLSDE
jgi:hypothetical protein